MKERRQERELELLKFEGEDRIRLNGVVRAVARELGEEDLKKAKKLVIGALEKKVTVEFIVTVIVDIEITKLLARVDATEKILSAMLGEGEEI